jgi:hypothetical protein
VKDDKVSNIEVIVINCVVSLIADICNVLEIKRERSGRVGALRFCVLEVLETICCGGGVLGPAVNSCPTLEVVRRIRSRRML